MKPTVTQAAGISSEAVHAKTGKGWDEWFALLDKAGARKMNHTQIAAYLHEQLGCPGWWNQMVANGYEQTRGLREKHQMPDGYKISSSKTVAATLSDLYRAWEDKRRRSQWLPDPAFTIRKATQEKSLRITWIDGKTSLEVLFYPKGEEKSEVRVQHSKLPTAKEGERMKQYWGKALERLKEFLEK